MFLLIFGGRFLVRNFVGCRKGDYYRYLAEFKSGNERKEAADLSLKAYQVCDKRLKFYQPHLSSISAAFPLA